MDGPVPREGPGNPRRPPGPHWRPQEAARPEGYWEAWADPKRAQAGAEALPEWAAGAERAREAGHPAEEAWLAAVRSGAAHSEEARSGLRPGWGSARDPCEPAEAEAAW